MATVAEIERTKEQALTILDEQIAQVRGRKNATPPGNERDRIDEQLEALRTRRSALHRAAVRAIASSEELEQALRGLEVATNKMTEVAAKMRAVTEFLNNAAELLAAADEAIGSLKQA